MTQLPLDLGGGSAASDAPGGAGAARGERIWIERGPRAVEARLLGEIARDADDARGDPRRLAQPLRVIVPSRSLREHVAARLAAAHGGLAGVVVQTLRGFARDLLRRAGEPDSGRGGELLLPVLVRRHAPEHEPLREALAVLDEGYGPVVESVRDLLDAGLDESSADAADEALAAVGADARVARGRAIVSLALRVRGELVRLGLDPPAALFVRGKSALQAQPALAAARALWIHGYADVTGVQLDLIEQLLALTPARLLLDHPQDPTGGAGVGAFTQRLRERLGASALPAEPAQLAPAPELLRAPGPQAEVRAVAERIRALLDGAGGPQPEAIGIVARNLAPYRFALATHLGRLGIPFSGGPGFVDPAGRRLRALLALLEAGARAPSDRWLDASALREGAGLELADLRVALHALGRVRLGDVAALDVDAVVDAKRQRYQLPVRTGLASDEGAAADPEAEGEPSDGEETSSDPVESALRAPYRSVSRRALEWARDDAAAALAACSAISAARTLAEHSAALRELVSGPLRWRRETPGRLALDAALAALARELPPELALDARELRLLLERALREAGVSALGGRGGGVQLLSATAARARTFSHLYVIGLERDMFPRVVSQDPLLPDELRQSLSVALPDMPVKARGYDEERFLFAQLCAAAEHVTLAWPETTDDGKERPCSPLVQRLRIAHGRVADAPVAPLVFDAREAPRPAHEHALLAGLAGDRAAAERATALALAPLLGGEALAAARARGASLAFRDAFETPRVLGPHLGQVGPVLAATGKLSVTRLEALARCPWQAFLEKLLGLRPPPDALAALPELSPLLVGNTVHAALEEIARRAGVPVKESLASALAQEPRDVPWPPGSELREIVAAAARAAASAQGVLLAGFAELLAQRALGPLERAQQLDWPSGSRSGVRGVEVECALELAVPGEAPLRVTCRADRVDQVGERLLLTDYKTGNPLSDAKGADTRGQHLRAAISKGTKLQAAAYARAAGGASTGRYLFVKPTLPLDLTEARLDAEEVEALESFEAAARTALAKWRSGELTPELIGDDEDSDGASCELCEVSEACWKGDAGAKRRLAAWRKRSGEAPPETRAGRKA